MLKCIRLVFLGLMLLLLPLGLAAQTAGYTSARLSRLSRPSYLARTTRTTSFKPKSFLAKSYTSKKATTSSFAVKKFTTSPLLKKSTVAQRTTGNKRSASTRIEFMKPTSYAKGRKAS